MRKVLIVEGDLTRATVLRRRLSSEGYDVMWARDAETGIRLAAEGEVDLVVLGSAPENGPRRGPLGRVNRDSELAQIIVPVRENGSGASGVDLVDVISRVGAVLGDTGTPAAVGHYAFGDVEVDFRAYQATKGGEPLELSSREFEILRFLVERRGEIVTREELLRVVWGNHGSTYTRTVDVHIAKLRKKIGDPKAAPRYIVTVHRAGYKFVC